MSSKKKETTVSIKVSETVRDKLRVVQEAYGASSLSETIDRLIELSHPDIDHITADLSKIDEQREEILAKIKKDQQ